MADLDSRSSENGHAEEATGARGRIDLFVPGRICLFGEHSDWAGGYRRFNSEIREGCALVCGTSQGIYASARKLLERRTVIFQTPDGERVELPVDDTIALRDIARSSSFFSYIAGTLLELGKHFRVSGAEIINHRTDMPMKKGLSSSAAVCVLVVRALNQLYDLKLTVHGEMDIAYRGEINTPSRCGRLDQCVAFGQTVTKMEFDNDLISTEQVRVASPIYIVVVDLCSSKDTKEILKCLNEAYPFPRNEQDKVLHKLLGDVNVATCAEAIEVISKEGDATRLAERLGVVMTAAQQRWDECAVPLCPHELKAPTLHRLLRAPELAPYVTGGKGIGSQGDGSAQLVCRSASAQDEAMKIVEKLGMSPLRLTISPSKSVRIAVVPIAGFSHGLWPATKCCGPWLFPIRGNDAVKPAICWLCEDLVAAGIEKIVLVVNEATESQMSDLFKRREDVQNLNSVPLKSAVYDEKLLAIGRCIRFVRQDRPTGIRDAVLSCEREVEGEPFLLAWGDHMYNSSKPGVSCTSQLIAAFDGSRSVVGMECVDREHLHLVGTFLCREPPALMLNPADSVLGAEASSESLPLQRLWPLSKLVEKPTRELADAQLVTPGLEPGKFLSSFGQHVLTTAIFQILRNCSPPTHFTEALDLLRQQNGVNGVMIEGCRWDLGNFMTYIEALQAQGGLETTGNAAKRARTSEA
eukprot:TRINITY_DN73653_c0_g1_i1.p1 TRINITY_DN73653_c0_g1~~TRINITY_DN73653_c0_g1_i1.p1  ORF type:complete len:713 (-),score=115.48 TRINITY_DN73653_c0_g1_i1:82-2163(-)